jgi:ATP synthase protein I
MLLTNRVFTKMLTWQAIATCVVASIFMLITGKNAAISALLGGFAIIFAAFLASLIFTRNRNKQDAAAILVSLILSEIIKLVMVFSFLFIVFKQYTNLVPVALIIGLIAAAMVSGVAMSVVTKSH